MFGRISSTVVLDSSQTSKLGARAALRNQRGQGLVEYLVIVALMGVATIAIVRTMGAVVSSRFAHVASALQGSKSSARKVEIEEGSYKKRDLGNFFNGVGEAKSSGSRGGDQYVGAE